MKRVRLGVFILSIALIGYIYNLLLYIPFMATLLFWFMPFAILIYWFWVGKKFAEQIKSPIIAILLGNSLSTISLLVYLWQFNFLSNSERNIWLAIFSQMFSAPISWITARLVFLFEADNGIITQASLNAMQLLGLLIMVSVFSVGYILERKKLYKRQKLNF